MPRSAPRAAKGFTLIELVLVVVILGALAAVALPKFQDVSEKAHEASLKAFVAAVEQASANNYLALKAGKPDAVNLATTRPRAGLCSKEINDRILGSYSENFNARAMAGYPSCSQAGVESMPCQAVSNVDGRVISAVYHLRCAGN